MASSSHPLDIEQFEGVEEDCLWAAAPALLAECKRLREVERAERDLLQAAYQERDRQREEIARLRDLLRGVIRYGPPRPYAESAFTQALRNHEAARTALGEVERGEA